MEPLADSENVGSAAPMSDEMLPSGRQSHQPQPLAASVDAQSPARSKRPPFWQPDNEFTRAILAARCSPASRLLVMAIYFATWGHPKKLPFRELSVSYLASYTALSERTVTSCLKALTAAGVLLEVRPESGTRGRTLGLEPDWRRWGSRRPSELETVDWQGLKHLHPDPARSAPFGKQLLHLSPEESAPLQPPRGAAASPKEEEIRRPEEEKNASRSQDGFDGFWEAYPRKEGKEGARKAWVGLRPEQRVDAVRGAERLGEVVATGGKELRYCEFPQRFLEEDRYVEWSAGVPDAYRHCLQTSHSGDGRITCCYCGRELDPDERDDGSRTNCGERGWYHLGCRPHP